MSKRKTSRKKSSRRKRKSKAEHVFGAIVIEGLGVLAILVMFVFARQASEPATPAMAETQLGTVAEYDPAGSVSVEPTNLASHLDWRIPDSNRFYRSWTQAE